MRQHFLIDLCRAAGAGNWLPVNQEPLSPDRIAPHADRGAVAFAIKQEIARTGLLVRITG
jgi:hypothetical protein